MARWLIERGADLNARATVNAEGFGGHTPLFHTVVALASARDDSRARLLLDHGADPNARATFQQEARFHGSVPTEALHDVTPIGYARRHPDQRIVNAPAIAAIAERGDRVKGEGKHSAFQAKVDGHGEHRQHEQAAMAPPRERRHAPAELHEQDHPTRPERAYPRFVGDKEDSSPGAEGLLFHRGYLRIESMIRAAQHDAVRPRSLGPSWQRPASCQGHAANLGGREDAGVK